MKYLVFVSSRSLKTRELSFAQFVYLFFFQFLNDKHTFLKKYTNWAKLSSLVLWDERRQKPQYFAPEKLSQRHCVAVHAIGSPADCACKKLKLFYNIQGSDKVLYTIKTQHFFYFEQIGHSEVCRIFFLRQPSLNNHSISNRRLL